MIANTLNGRYDLVIAARAGVMVKQDAAEIERRLNAGEWLKAGAVAKLLGLGRTTVHDLLNAEKIGYRRTPGGQRECDPADVKRLLDERRQVHHGKTATTE